MAETFGLKDIMDNAESKCLSCGAPMPAGREEQCKYTGGKMWAMVLGEPNDDLDRLYTNVVKALQELSVAVEISKDTDSERISRYHIRKLPALVINGSIMSQGIIPNVEEIKEEIEYMY